MTTRSGPAYVIFACLACLAVVGCNNLSDEQTQVHSIFKPGEVIHTIKDDTLLLFNAQKGYVVHFKGVRSCTLRVNGAIVSATDNDSLYSRFTTQDKGVLSINDSLYGSMEFSEQEIHDWQLLLNEIKDSTDFISTVLKTQMDTGEYYAVKTSATANNLTVSSKASVVKAFQECIDNTDFYHDNKIIVDSNLVYSFMRDTFYADLGDMAHRGLFLDSGGTVKSNLTLEEREEIKWFNWRIFVKYFDPDPENTFKTKFYKYPACGRLFSVNFQQAKTWEGLPGTDITRYFEHTNTGLFQVAFKDNTIHQKLFDTRVNDLFLITSTTWKVTPLFRLSDLPFIGGEPLARYDTPGNATIHYIGTSAFRDTTWFQLNLYYAVNKTVMRQGSPLTVRGTIHISAGFLKHRMAGKQGQFDSWDTEIFLQANTLERDSLVQYREKSFLKPDYSMTALRE